MSRRSPTSFPMCGKGHFKRTTNLTIYSCQRLFHLSDDEAANRLGVSRLTIARVMHAHGYSQWPFRSVRALIRHHSDPGNSLIDPQGTPSLFGINRHDDNSL